MTDDEFAELMRSSNLVAAPRLLSPQAIVIRAAPPPPQPPRRTFEELGGILGLANSGIVRPVELRADADAELPAGRWLIWRDARSVIGGRFWRQLTQVFVVHAAIDNAWTEGLHEGIMTG